MYKSFAKTGIFTALMIGHISVGDIGFLEDDSDFNLAPDSVSAGWGWGLNRADAQQMTDIEDTVGVTATYEEPEIPNDPVPEPDIDWDEQGGGSDGGGGSSGSGEGSEGGSGSEEDERCAEIKAKVNRCKTGAVSEARSELDDCKGGLDYQGGISASFNVYVLQITISGSVGQQAANCASDVERDYKMAIDQCEFKNELYLCE